MCLRERTCCTRDRREGGPQRSEVVSGPRGTRKLAKLLAAELGVVADEVCSRRRIGLFFVLFCQEHARCHRFFAILWPSACAVPRGAKDGGRALAHSLTPLRGPRFTWMHRFINARSTARLQLRRDVVEI